MADLYSKSKLKEAASIFENINLSPQIAIIQQIYDDFKAKSTEAETQYEQIFNDLFFGQLLEYENGKHRIPQATTPIGGKRADLALGFFEDNKYSFDGVKVVVELKGSNISLDHKQHGHGGQTPVDQGFGYKTSFKDCPWLIVSNFASIRLYRDNKQDFQSWTLEQLLDSTDNYFHLRSLLGLLKHKYLIGVPGTTPKSEQYLSEFRIQQEQISKAFYKEYSKLRIELINDIKYNNPDLDVETLVSKAQKIIDRIIFIHFCEDYGLLPEGKILEVIQYSQSLINVNIRQILTGFFEAVNKGSEKLGIPSGYNGGLFATDSILNNLKVGDKICQKFVEVGRYDFEDDLSVNILGHIFEQSISDIEQLKIDLLGSEITTDQIVEQKQSKRKKDGIFYTPGYIVDYIVQNSLGKYLSEKEEACLKKHSNKKMANN